jgi:hypothetical protein
MTFLPIVERELRGAARLTSTYRNRVIVAAAVTGVAMVMLAFGSFSSTPSQVGRAMFWTLTYMTLAFCLFEGARKTADCLSEEKREGTLGLLFLTDLKGYDVILGKLTGKSLSSVYGLISILPILALPLMLGGVTGGEYWRVVLAITNLLFFSLCAGIWISCLFREERHAMSGTFLLVLGWVIAPLLLHIHPFSPLYALNVADDRSYKSFASNYWASIGFAQLFSWAMLLWASLTVPNCWREEKTIAINWWQRRQKRRENPEQRAERRAQMLDINPAYWLTGRDLGRQAWSVWGFGICMIVVGAVSSWYAKFGSIVPYLAICWFINLMIKMRVAAAACHSFAVARRCNALEMLLVTPLTTEQIVNGQLMALRRAFLGPIIGVFGIEIAGLLFVGAMAGHGQFDGFTPFVFGLIIVGYIALFALDMVALAWTGMSLGLSSKKESHAVTKTILLLLVLPMCSMIFFCYGYIFIIAIPLICIANHRVKMKHEFRKVAGQPYTGPANQSWVPGLLPEHQPPIQRIS